MADKASVQHADNEDIKQTVTVDTVHNDDAAKVLGNYHDQRDWTADEEKRLLRKLDRLILPLLFSAYALQFYDKGMLSHAALFGLIRDLELTGDRYSFASSIFYLGYATGTFPSMMLMQRFPLERVAAAIIGLWGVCLLCTVACTDYKTLYVQRFFLGLLEGGVSPMCMVIVSSFYKKGEQSLRQGVWMSSGGWTAMISPLINYGLGHITGGALPTWGYMYMFAGAITVLYAFLILFYLPSDPTRARSLNERERYIAVARLQSNNTGVRNTHIKWAQFGEMMIDLRFWLMFSVAFLAMITNGPLSTFVPLIIRGMGYSPLNSLLLSMPVGFVAGSTILISSFVATRVASRGWRTWVASFMSIPVVVAAVLLWQLPHSATGGLLVGIYLLGTFASTYAIMSGIHTSNVAGYTKKSATAAGYFLGYCMGNFTGPLLFKPEDAPSYQTGFLAVTITSIVTCLLPIAYRYLCIYENKRRDNAGVPEGFDHAYDDDLTDVKNPQFRYSL